MPIDSLNVAKQLRSTFAHRDALGHRGNNKVQCIKGADIASPNIYLVKEPSLSRQVLCSSAVVNSNYFSNALAYMERQGRPLPLNAQFFTESPLFRDGECHRETRRAMGPHVDDICACIREQRPRLERFFFQRQQYAWTPLRFAQQLVELCFALAISRLTGVSHLTARRSIRARASVFFFHFHPARHVQLERALSRLQVVSRRSQESADLQSKVRMLLAQSLIVMGVDPTVAAMCGAIINDTTDDFSRASNRYCPTSFVSRVCIRPFQLESVTVNAGDVLYLSLLPGVDDEGGEVSANGGPPIAFGAGLHVCIGKPVVMAVSNVAQAVYPRVSSVIRSSTVQIHGDGAFLRFTEQPAP